MRNIISAIAIVINAIAIFTAASYFNTFKDDYISSVLKFLLCFAYGYILNLYYDRRSFWITSTVFTALILYILFPFGEYDFAFRFPQTSLILLSFIVGYFWAQVSIAFKILLPILVGMFIMLNLKIIHPRYSMKYFSVNKLALMGRSIYKYLDNVSIVDSMERKHSVYIDGNVRLLEFYFKSCSPCKLKIPVLNRVSSRFKDVKNFKLINIENGRIDDFNDYTSYLKTKRGLALYDSAGIFSKNLGIDAYPYEIIVDKKGVIRYIFDGFDHSVNNLYYTETINKITTLLNE